jgi:glycosyltransferase involved in cell wall biosynthesis
LLGLKKVDTIHCFCTPAGVLGYILSILSRKRLIIDSFEPHAEPMIETGTWSKNGLPFKILFFFEGKMAKKADDLILCVSSMKSYVKEKFNVNIKAKYVKPACVDFSLFDYAIENSYLKKELCLENKIVGVYAGKFGGLYLKRETIEIFKAAYDFWGDQFRVLLLSNHDCTEILIWCKELELPSNIIVKRFVEFKNMPLYLSCANFAISPYSPIPSRRFGAPIKNAEYMAMGLPILITKDSANDSEFISQNNIGAVIGDLNYNSYFSAIRKIDVLLRLDNFELKSGISSIAKRHKNFDIADKIYQEIYSKSN